MKKLAVVALGGNALLRGTQLGTIDEQNANTMATLNNLIFLLRDGYELIITHGNGPQVGNILMRNDAGEQIYKIPQMPLDICVADSQGGIGYMIERILRNVLQKHGILKEIISLISQVVVKKDDIAFKNPLKRIGKSYTRAEVENLKKHKNWEFKQGSKVKDGWRRVVPSPMPISLLNHTIVKNLAKQGNIVITAGGGGIPVCLHENQLHPVEAVVDKDRVSALLATLVGADELYILTDVPYIYKNFGKPNQEILEFLDYRDTVKYLEAGEFGKGNMRPKIMACLQFIKAGGRKAVITEATQLEDKKYGSKITMEYEN